MPACASETVAPVWPTQNRDRWLVERARAGSSSSSCSSSSSEAGSPRPGSPAEWIPYSEPKSFLSRVLGWYPALVLRIFHQMLTIVLYLVWNKIFLSTGLWLLDCILKFPLEIAKWILSALYGSRGLGRTVLITGSSIETLQIARNFYQSGARVVIIEHDDRFGLVRFSTSVDKFYKVPVPQKYPQEYLRELCRIAEHENASYFIPTSTSHPAHFDALAKPYLEQLGVICIIGGIKEICLMDDPSSMLQLCHDAGLQTPVHFRISTPEQLTTLYEDGQLRRARHVLLNAGPISTRDDQIELELPQTRRGLRRFLQTQPKAIVSLCANRPAVVLQIPEGERLVTCTTVRDGHVVANVTCRAPLPDEDTPPLEPLERDDVDQWLQRLLSALPPSRVFTGHITFTFISTRNGLVPINCRFGVKLPYLCYASQHSRLLMRPCKHHHATVSQKTDKNAVVLPKGRYWLHDTVLNTVRCPSFTSLYLLLNSLICKHEALYTPWDPIPSSVYYGLQTPARAVLRLLQGSNRFKLKNPPHHHLVHFSNDIPVENGITKNGLVSSSSNNNVNCKNVQTSIVRTISSFSVIPEDDSIVHHHKNGHVNGVVVLRNGYKTNGHITNGHATHGHISNGHIPNGHIPNNHIPSGDLIQL